MVSYHDNDFDYNEWAMFANENFKLPDIHTERILDGIESAHGLSDSCYEMNKWQAFYVNHKTGLFYKPRRYLYKEFEKYLPSISNEARTIFEVGCGHGCSTIPLLEYLPSAIFFATDYSQHALDIMKMHPKYSESRIHLCQWDITLPAQPNFVGIADAAICVFALSAVSPSLHLVSLKNIASTLRPGGLVLFRDYAEHDMTMYRHTIRLGDKLYRRNDGTLAFYFTKECIIELANHSNLIIEELSYATVLIKNRSSGTSMNRVFLHAVLRKL